MMVIVFVCVMFKIDKGCVYVYVYVYVYVCLLSLFQLWKGLKGCKGL